MIFARVRRLPFYSRTAMLTAGALFTLAPQIAGAADSNPGAHANDVVLPPPPAYGTPANQMRLPNLKPLGDDADSSYAPATPPPAAADLRNSTPRSVPAAPMAHVEDSSPAAVALRKLKQRTGLSDAQLVELRTLEQRVNSGDQAGALRAAQALSIQLDKDGHIYPVGDGQNLFSIAGQDGVYANSNLWPLLWWNNQPELPRPSQLRTNARLRVLAHPTIEQVTFTLNYARFHSVLTAPVEDRDLLTRMTQH